jgi:diacylglycerol kinase (ATP)
MTKAPDSTSFSVASRVRSFGYAFEGLYTLLREQHNAWIHLLATAVVIGAGLWFGLGKTDWLFITLAITGVWVTEALNTAVELLCDVASPEFHPLVKKCKDIAAGAVLLSALGAVVVGALVFWPRLVTLLP